MEHLIIPEGYEPALNLHDTQIAIKTVKDFFQALLAQRLHLTRVCKAAKSASRISTAVC